LNTFGWKLDSSLLARFSAAMTTCVSLCAPRESGEETGDGRSAC
jgi:hypothetical protein